MFRRRRGAENFLGRWMTDPGDSEDLRAYERVTMEFHPNGALTYTIHRDAKE